MKRKRKKKPRVYKLRTDKGLVVTVQGLDGLKPTDKPVDFTVTYPIHIIGAPTP